MNYLRTKNQLGTWPKNIFLSPIIFRQNAVKPVYCISIPPVGIWIPKIYWRDAIGRASSFFQAFLIGFTLYYVARKGRNCRKFPIIIQIWLEHIWLECRYDKYLHKTALSLHAHLLIKTPWSNAHPVQPQRQRLLPTHSHSHQVHDLLRKSRVSREAWRPRHHRRVDCGWEDVHQGTHRRSTQAWPNSQISVVAGWRWVYFKRYTQGGRYLITWALPILKLFVRDSSKVTSRNSRWHSVFVSLRLPASWCTTGTVLPWLLTNIRETLVTNTHLNGSKPSKQNAGSGRVALSCWRWCFALCETFLIIPGYRHELGPGAALCQWVTSSEQGE